MTGTYKRKHPSTKSARTSDHRRRPSRMWATLTATFLAGAALVAVSVPSADAAVISVPCSSPALVSAITTANAESSGEVSLTAGCSYGLTAAAVTDPTYGPTGLPAITGNVQIAGNGATITRSAGAPTFRVLLVQTGATLTVQDLTIGGGTTLTGAAGTPVGPGAPGGGSRPGQPGPTANPGASAQSGGGVVNAGTLSATGLTVTGNSTGAGGTGGAGGNGGAGGDGPEGGDAGAGGAGSQGGTGGHGGDGGGIYNIGTLTLTESTVSNNTVGDGGAGGIAGAGGLGGSGSSHDPLKRSNAADGGLGGTGGMGGRGGSGAGIASDAGLVTLDDSTVSGNAAGAGGSGGSAGEGGNGGDGPGVITGAAGSGGGGGTGGTGGAGGNGGGISSNATLVVTGSTIENNVAGAGGLGGSAANPGTSGTPGDNENGALGGAGGNGGAGGAGGNGGGVASTGPLTVISTLLLTNNGGNANVNEANVEGTDGAIGGTATLSSFANAWGTAGNGGVGGNGGAGADGGRGGAIAVLGSSASVLSSAIRGNSAGIQTYGGNGGNGGDGFAGGAGSNNPPVPHGTGGNGGNGGNGGTVGTSSGGGIYNTASLTLANSTVGNNVVPSINQYAQPNSGTGGHGGNGGTSGTAGGANPGVGGGAGNGGNGSTGAQTSYGGGLDNTGTAAVINVTFAANAAAFENSNISQPGDPGVPGDGVPHGRQGTIGQYGTPPNTSTANTVANHGSASQLTMTNTVIGPSPDPNPDCSGPIHDGGGNYNADGSCSFASGASNPQLAADWADNGGPTPTIALSPTSPAVDGGIDSACDAAPISHVDQRGVGRPQGAHCDSGAYEVAGQPQTNPFTVTTTLFRAFGSCTTTLCTLPDAVAAANTLGGSATVGFNLTGTFNVPSPLTITGNVHIAANATTDLTLSGPQLFTVAANGTLALSTISMQGNTVANGQHMITNQGTLALDDVVVANDSAFNGPAIIENAGQTITVNRSSFVNNGALVISNDGDALNITGSTFSGNQSNNSVIAQNSFAVIANSTFSGNQTNSAVSNNGTTRLVNDTFSGNGNGTAGADVANATPGLEGVTAINTIFDSATYGSCNSPIIDGGNNLETGSTCGLATSRSNRPPLLQPLADNGGPTQTMDLQPGSPAIDTGLDAACQAAPILGIDQRGITRPQGTHCDIGAVEADSISSFINGPTSGSLSSSSQASGPNPVTVISATDATGALANTGTPVEALTLAGLIALIVGAGFTTSARRRRLGD